MQELVFTALEQTTLQNLGVEAVVLFGSQAQGNAGALSDVDIGVLTAFLPAGARRREIYDALYDMVSGKIHKLVDIDIVFLRDVPMELQYHVAKYGVVLYAAHASAFARFREQVMDAYADFAPLRRVFHEAILARIPI